MFFRIWVIFFLFNVESIQLGRPIPQLASQTGIPLEAENLHLRPELENQGLVFSGTEVYN